MSGRVPLVAVVIITYHGDRFLRTAIDSVRAQTFPDFELVVVEDGSRDETAAIVASYNDPRLRYVWRPNGGLSAARNSGVAASTAPLVAFLDVDDWWHPEKLRAQVATLGATPDAGVVYSSATMVPEGDDDPSHRVLDLAKVDGEVRPTLLLSNCITGSASSVMVRRHVLEQVGGFDETVRFAEDWDCWLRLAAVTHFAIVPEPHVFLLVRPASYGRNSEALRVGSHQLLDRALDAWEGTTPALRRRSHAIADLVASVDFSERGMRREAWRPLFLAIARDPFHLVFWKRLIVLLMGRA